MLKVAVFTAVIVYRLHSGDKNENEPLLSGAQVPELGGEVWRNNCTDSIDAWDGFHCVQSVI